jgi:hypothetical protein
MSNVFVFRQPPSGFHPEYFGGGGKGGTTTQSVSIPPEVLARYNAVNARAEDTAKQPFQAYSGEFVAPLTSTQQAGIQGTNAAANMAQPFYGAATQQLLGAQQGGSNYINAATNQLGQAQDVGQGLALGALGSYQQAGTAASPYYRAATQGTQAALAGAQPYQQMATQAALAGAQGISPGQLQTEQYMSPYTQNVVEATRSGLRQQFGQQASQQQAEAIKAGAFGGDRAGLQRQMLRGQQALAESQAISPLYQQAYNQALQTAQQQQGVGLGAAQANRAALQQTGQQLGALGQQGYGQQLGAAQQMAGLGQALFGQGMQGGQALASLGQQQYGQGAQSAQQLAALGQQGYGMGAGTSQALAGLGTGAQGAALQGSQAQMAAGQVQQQTQQAQDTAQYQQFLQERGYPFQVAQFLANIAMGTGALSGSTTTTQAPGGFFSDERLKKDIKEIGKTHDGQPIYSYKYKNDDRTQIGLMAQDVEKKHPEAVGLLGGYKTVDYKKATEDAERTHKDMGGGLVPDGFDASSMGGAVTSGMAGEGFERGGYVGGGLVGDNDWAQIIAANKAALGVYGGGQGPYGGAGAGGIGAGGIVPQGAIATPKLVTAGSLPQQRPSGLSTAMQTGRDIQSTYKGGKEFLLGSPKTKDDPTGSPGFLGGQGELGGKNVFTKGKEAFEDFFKPATAAGGLIVPRKGYEDGGETDNEVTPYDPAETMRGEDPMKDVLAAGNKKYELQKPGQLPGGGGGGSPLGNIASGIGAAKGIYEAGSWLGGTALPFLMSLSDARVKDNIRPVGKTFDGQNIYSYNIGEGPTQMGLMAQEVLDRKPEAVGHRGGLLTVDYDRATEDANPFAYGGLVPRQAHADGDRVIPRVIPDYSEEADLPSAGAQEAGLVVERPDREKVIRTFLPINEQMESGGNPNAKNSASSASGLFQFTKPTWAGLVAKYPDRGWTEADIMNPQAQREMAPLHANDLLNSFQKSGIDPSHQALRMGWAFGEAGGPAFMKNALANPDAPGTSFASRAAVQANPTWFFNKDGSAKTASETMNTVLGKFGSGTREAPVPPGLVGAGIDRSAAPAEGKKGLGETLTSEGFLVPALGFLGSMLASNRPNLGGALGEGILGGVGAYQQQRKMLPEVAKTEAEATQQNVAAINALSSGLKRYNALNGTNLTLQQFAKLTPVEIAKYAGASAASAVSGQNTSSGGYTYDPDEPEKLVIKRSGQPDIPAHSDPAYLTAFKAHWAKLGDDPYAQKLITWADKQLEESKTSTISSTGERIPAPGAIETAQKGEVGKGLAKEALDFNQEKRMFMQESPKILTSVNQIADIVSKFPTGVDVTARANLDRIMKSIDPDNKFNLWTGAAGDYDTMVKNAMIIGLSQLKGLSPRAPAAELEAIKRQIPEGKMDPEAIRTILSGLKADVEYKKKMYNSFDIDKHTNVNKVLSEFMEKEPYEEFVKQTKKELKPGAGTKAQVEQKQQPAALQAPEPIRNLQGLSYSPSRNQYRDAEGNIYDASGKKVQ